MVYEMTFDWNTFIFGFGEATVVFLTIRGLHYINNLCGYDYPIETEDSEDA
jgi:hypothetical protein